MNKIMDFVLKKAVFTLFILLLITGFFAYQLIDKAYIETNMDEYMPKDHPAFELSDEYEDLFNIKDAVVVAVENEDGIYNQQTLNKIVQITEKLGELEDINSNNIRSIASADNIVGSDFGLEVKPFFKEIPETEDELDVLKEEIVENEMVSGRVVAKNHQVAMISAELEDGKIDRLSLYQEVKEIVAGMGGPEKIYIAGQPVVEGTLANLMPADMKRMIPLVVFLIFVVLLLIFGSFKSTILTLLVVLFSTIWAFGLMATLGIPIYAVSTMIPVMLIALGVADGIHLLTNLHRKVKNRPAVNKVLLIKEMIKELWKPVVMTSITTAVGFISLLTSEVYPIKYFGLFTAFGVMAAMLFSLIFIPIGLKLSGLPKLKRKKNKKSEDSKVFSTTSDWVLKYKKLIFITAIILVILALIGIQRVWINSSFLSKFEEDEEIAIANNFINQHFGGTTNLNIIISSPEIDGMKNPGYLKDIWNLQTELEAIDEVGDSYALTDFLRRINKVMNENQEEFNIIPDSAELIAQYLLLYSMSGDPETLDNLIDYDYRRVNLRLNLKSDDARLIKKVIEQVEEFKDNSSLAELKIDYAGSAYTNMVFADLILEGQIKSLILSLIIIVILVGLLFKSFLAGILGSIPIAITAIINFGVMGFLNIPLNTTTALISSIAVGMGIDYSIHLLSNYRSTGQQGLAPRAVVRETMEHSGRAIVFNAIVVIVGFLVLIFSSFPPNRELGYLVSLSMFSSFVLTLTLTVALIDYLKPEFIFKDKLDNER